MKRKATSRSRRAERDTLLEAARDNYPSAISAESIREAELEDVAKQLVRDKLLVRAKVKGGTAYRWPDPLPQQAVIVTKPRGSGAPYEREVQDAMKKLREIGSMAAKKPPTRR